MIRAHRALIVEHLARYGESPPPKKRECFSIEQPFLERLLSIAFVLFIIGVLLFFLIPYPGSDQHNLSHSSPRCVAGVLAIDDSTILQPLIEAVAREYMKHCPEAAILVGNGSSNKGLIDIEQGKGVLSGVALNQSKSGEPSREVLYR
jgi:ABC-type phosphate transport system substrate-binding protein